MIYINGRFLTQSLTGVQRYAIEICKQLPKTINGQSLVLLIPKTDFLKFEALDHLSVIQFGFFKGNLWEQIDLPIFLKKRNASLLLNFGGIGPVFYKNKITYIHDLAFKHSPESYAFLFQKMYQFLIPKSAKNSKKILTVSEYVKKDIYATYSYKNVEVVYPAISSKFSTKGMEREKIILAVSSLSPRKNIKRVIEAFCKLETDYKLVFIGSAETTFSNFNIDDYKNKNSIIFTGYLKDNAIIDYYRRASVFIYASISEGFGIPPLEAQACGCPCLVANVTSLPEVYKDSVEYCDPYSVDDIKNKLEKLIHNQALRDSLIKKGLENTQRYSWKESAKKLLDIIIAETN